MPPGGFSLNIHPTEAELSLTNTGYQRLATNRPTQAKYHLSGRQSYPQGPRSDPKQLEAINEAPTTKLPQLVQACEMDEKGDTNNKADQRPSDELKALFAPAIAAQSTGKPTYQSHPRKKLPKRKRLPIPTKTPVEAAASHTAMQSARPSSRTTSSNQNTQHVQPRQPSDPVVAPPQQPCEANGFGVDTGDGVIVGRPPEFPPGLLDWDSPEDADEMEELVCNRRARRAAAAATAQNGSSTRRARVSNNGKSPSEGDESGSDGGEWVHV